MFTCTFIFALDGPCQRSSLFSNRKTSVSSSLFLNFSHLKINLTIHVLQIEPTIFRPIESGEMKDKMWINNCHQSKWTREPLDKKLCENSDLMSAKKSWSILLTLCLLFLAEDLSINYFQKTKSHSSNY